MTVAVERLAVLAAVTLPITAPASVYGMNVLVNGSTNVAQLLLVLAVMALISGTLLRWTKRQGWWWGAPARPSRPGAPSSVGRMGG